MQATTTTAAEIEIPSMIEGIHSLSQFVVKEEKREKKRGEQFNSIDTLLEVL